MDGVGIFGIGVYLPDLIRTNDWWPASLVATWRERQARSFLRTTAEEENELGPGAARVLRAMQETKGDPFEGSRTRHIMSADMRSSDMELIAARRALADARIGPTQIGFLLTHSTTGNYLNVPNTCLLHRELGLPERCFSLETDAMCNAFLQQLILARALVRDGVGRYGLIIQSSAMSRLVRSEDPFSAWFGDGATAVVVGPCSSDAGVLATASLTDGSVYGGIVCGIPGQPWYSEARVIAYLADPQAGRRMFLKAPDQAQQLVEDALDRAGLVKEDVRLFAVHQSTIWFGRVIQEHLALTGAARVDTFADVASLSGGNIPYGLSLARERDLLHRGDVVVMYAGAAGMTATSVVLRWSAP